MGSSPYYTDVIAIHPKNSPGSSADCAIVYFQSTYHKNFAAAEIRRYLVKERIAGTGLRDLFLPRAAMETSKMLTTKGFDLKKRGVIQKFCVDNWAETPIIFVSRKDRPFVRVSMQQIDDMLREDVMDETV